MVAHTYLDVDEVQFDPANPRIAPLLEPYEQPSPEHVAMALQPGDRKHLELQQAIVTNEGIINPIIVNNRAGHYVAIEGNTRLAIYKKLHREAPEDERWSKIPSIVYEDMKPETVDAVRLQAHLVGVRNWSPFAKARYLFHLHVSEHLPFNALVEFCGGNQMEVQRNIQAYRDMQDHYRPLVPDDEFDDHKFSLFLEAQKPKLREALVQHGFTVADVAEWVVQGRFEPRQELIRKLPQILATPRAREEFFRRGAQSAEGFIDRPEVIQELQSVSLPDLCSAIQQKLNDIKRQEIRAIRESEELIQTIEDTITDLRAFYEEDLTN